MSSPEIGLSHHPVYILSEDRGNAEADGDDKDDGELPGEGKLYPPAELPEETEPKMGGGTVDIVADGEAPTNEDDEELINEVENAPEARDADERPDIEAEGEDGAVGEEVVEENEANVDLVIEDGPSADPAIEETTEGVAEEVTEESPLDGAEEVTATEDIPVENNPVMEEISEVPNMQDNVPKDEIDDNLSEDEINVEVEEIDDTIEETEETEVEPEVEPEVDPEPEPEPEMEPEPEIEVEAEMEAEPEAEVEPEDEPEEVEPEAEPEPEPEPEPAPVLLTEATPVIFGGGEDEPSGGNDLFGGGGMDGDDGADGGDDFEFGREAEPQNKLSEEPEEPLLTSTKVIEEVPEGLNHIFGNG